MKMLAILLIVISVTSSSQVRDLQLPPLQKQIIEEMTWPLKLVFLKDYADTRTTEPTRRVGIEFLKLEPASPARRQDREVDVETDESSMKMKLFRLMYETVRDSDLKVKRAELIKGHYANSSAFEIGYLMGDITDKYNVMSDIALTLKRLYNEWKPLEHINAYEQIANQAIEINHILEMMRSAEKRSTNKTTTAPQ